MMLIENHRHWREFIITYETFPVLFSTQYVGVAGLHNGTMELGGNLPDTLSQYLVLGHGDNNSEEDDQEDDGEEKLKVGN